jgi:tetratricopeptide (TPR) repeat protein
MTAPLSCYHPSPKPGFRAGALVYTLGHRDEAIGCFRRAAAAGGKTSFGPLGKARALLTEDRNHEAEQVLRHTLALDPGNAMAHDLLGNLLSEFGRFDAARECLQRAIAIAPLLAGSYYIWSGVARSRAMTSACFNGWKPPCPRRGWKRRNACGFTSRSARLRTILATTPWPCSISTPQMPCARALRRSTRPRSPSRPIA